MMRVIKKLKDNYIFKGLCFGLPVTITFLDNVASFAEVKGISMQPELNPQPAKPDYIFLNRWSANFYRISRGDIVTLISPKDPNVTMVKRVVGLENDVIHSHSYKTEFVKIPEGHCWVEGDNTAHSFDSNSFGPVSLGLITGKADYIIWPPNRWRSLNPKKDKET